jgi:hypothetical protein
LESLFGDESPNPAMNGGFHDSVIDNQASQETVADEAPSQQEICRDVFLTSSFDGAVSLWDRRRDGMVARLAPGPRGTPPWCVSVMTLISSDKRHVGQQMEISFMLGGEMGLLMSIQCINYLVHLHEVFDFLVIQDLSHLSPLCQTEEISYGTSVSSKLMVVHRTIIYDCTI